MHQENRRSFVKKSLATSVSISFAGLIRAHGAAGGGTTTWNPNQTTMHTTFSGTTTWNPDGTTYYTTGGTSTWDPDVTTEPILTTSPDPNTFVKIAKQTPTGGLMSEPDDSQDGWIRVHSKNNNGTPGSLVYEASLSWTFDFGIDVQMEAEPKDVNIDCMRGTVKNCNLKLIRTMTTPAPDTTHKDDKVAGYPITPGPVLTRAATARGKLDGPDPKVYLDAFIGDTTKSVNGIKFTLEATATPADANQTRTIKWVATPDFSAFDKSIVKDTIQAAFEAKFDQSDYIVSISMPTPVGTAYDRSQSITASTHTESLGGSQCALTP